MQLLAAIMPEESDRLRRLQQELGEDDRPADTPIHGDLHLQQILVRDRSISGLIDLDTAGLGRPGDDPANLLAHLTALTVAVPRSSDGRDPYAAYADRVLRTFDRLVDPVDLRRRTAAAVLGLAAGQFQGQTPCWPERIRQRLVAAERWLESADRVRATTPLVGRGSRPGAIRSTGREMRDSTSAA